MSDDIQSWIDGLTADQIMSGISKAIKARDWLVVDGLMKMLAIKDPASAQAVLDTIDIAAAVARAGEDTR